MKTFTLNLKGLNDSIKPIIGLITIFGVFGYLYGITFFEVRLPKDIVPQVLIAIVAFGKDIYNYFFGSSQGMAKANETIALTNKNTSTQNVEELNAETLNVKKKP